MKSLEPKKQAQWRIQYCNRETNMNGVGFVEAPTKEDAKERYECENSDVKVTGVEMEKTLDNLYKY